MASDTTKTVFILSSFLLFLCPIDAGECDITIDGRNNWTQSALDDLTDQGFSTPISGRVKFAPIGTISNPAGTYGAIMFDNPGNQYPSQEFCSCLNGDVSVSSMCYQLESPVSSGSKEASCSSTYIVAPSDIVLIVGCTPPESQFFAYQTNVYSKFSTDDRGIYFPEVSPYVSLNHAIFNTTSSSQSPFNAAFVTISTADANSAQTAKQALIDAGVPEAAINIDALDSADVKFWDGVTDWKEQLPDSLELIVRINGAIDEVGVDKYIYESGVISSQQAFLLRAPTSAPNTFISLNSTWPRRIVTSDESSIAQDYAGVLDQFAIEINNTAKAQGYIMSYYGDAKTSMDFGYYQPSPTSKKEEEMDDVEECCLDYPHNSQYWSSTVHYSTSDCLYETYGYLSDPRGGWNDSAATLIANTRYMSTEVTGPPQNISYYSQFACSSENASGYDALIVRSICSVDTCNECAFVGYLSDYGVYEGCFPSTINGLYEEFTCIDGVPTALAYKDDTCSEAISTYDLSVCSLYETDTTSEQMWTGGVFRENTIVVMIGTMSNKLNVSSFHDIYLPLVETYFSPGQQLDFTEDDLNGSGVAFMPEGGDEELYENLFMAQWGRSCLTTNDGSSDNAPCLEVTTDSLPSNSTYYMFMRHYLDPNTNTGPHKDALPRHRILVFDKL